MWAEHQRNLHRHERIACTPDPVEVIFGNFGYFPPFLGKLEVDGCCKRANQIVPDWKSFSSKSVNETSCKRSVVVVASLEWRLFAALVSDVTTLWSVVVVASLGWRLFAALASDVTTLRSVVVVASLGCRLFARIP